MALTILPRMDMSLKALALTAIRALLMMKLHVLLVAIVRIKDSSGVWPALQDATPILVGSHNVGTVQKATSVLLLE